MPAIQTCRRLYIDGLAAESLNFRNAVSGCPVCCPARASLLTGQSPLEHRVIVNDVPLGDRATSIAQAFAAGGYDTAYIGKWHVDGQGRSNYIPPERRQGFDYWKVLECTHDYNNSFYYAGDSDEKLRWKATTPLSKRAMHRPTCATAAAKILLMVLSWGPPHDPYQTAPQAIAICAIPQRSNCVPTCRLLFFRHRARLAGRLLCALHGAGRVRRRPAADAG